MKKKRLTVKEALVKARRLLTRGWTKGAYFDPATNCFCAVGAINQATIRQEYTDSAESENVLLRARVLKRVAKAATGVATDQQQVNSARIIDWNDRTDITKKDVIAAFNKAIAAA